MPTTHHPLRVVLQSLDYPPGSFVSSIGFYTKALAEALAAHGHRVHVLCRSDADKLETLNGVRVQRLGPARLNFPPRLHALAALRSVSLGFASEWRYRQRLAAALSELVAREGIDVIEAADTGAEALFYKPGRHAEVPFIVRLHGPTAVWERFDKTAPELARRLIWRLERKLFLSASHLTVPSSLAEKLFREEMKLGDKPITVLPNIPTFELNEHAPQAPDPNLVLFVGRLTPQKGAQLLTQAIPQVLAARPETVFVFAGPNSSTSQPFPSAQDYLLSLVPERYRQALRFTGFLPREALARYYEQAAVVAIPSLFESFGYSCLEAMLYGKAIVASPTGGMGEMLGEGSCGLIYNPPDIADLAGKILRLLENPALAADLGAKARARARLHYRSERIAAEVEAFYRKAIAEQAQRQRPARQLAAKAP